MKVDLGINLGFAINRYIEPEVWTKIVAEDLGLRKVQFVADLLNPALPETYRASQIDRIQNACARYGISVESMFTSAFTRVNHLMHPDEEARLYWYNWFRRFIEIGHALGAKSIGSHMGIFTFDAFANRYATLLQSGIELWQKLSEYAAEKEYAYMIIEPMSVPRELCHTILETKNLLARLNQNAAIPFRCCLDVGHAPDPSNRDPYPWLEQLGHISPVIHLQQTVLHKSNHWPFIKEYNKQGIIKPDKVLAALATAKSEEAFLVFEISHREHHDTDYRIISDLRESVDYWKEGLADAYASGSITRPA